jgi:hypothetical protein
MKLLTRRLAVKAILLSGVGVAVGQEPAAGPGPKRNVQVVPAGGERQKWAFLVGLNDYGDKRIPSLNYCRADMKSFRDTLIWNCGFPENHVFLLHDRPEEIKYKVDGKPVEDRKYPTRVAILQRLDEILEHVGPNDQVVVAFSLHGVLHDGAAHLCPHEADMDKLGTTLLSVRDVYDKLERVQGAEKVLIIDACRDPVKVGRGVAMVPTGSGFAQGLQGVPRNVILLHSCAAGEQSYEHNALQHGVFSHFLQQGLRGKADARKNRSVNVEDLFQYAKLETAKYVRANWSKSQTPEMVCADPADPRSMVLARLDDPRPPQVPFPREIDIGEISEDEERTRVVTSLARVAMRVAEEGNRDQAWFITKRALKIAEQIKDALDKDRNLAEIAKALAGAKEFLVAAVSDFIKK